MSEVGSEDAFKTFNERTHWYKKPKTKQTPKGNPARGFLTAQSTRVHGEDGKECRSDRDPDAIFGEYVATELKAIKDDH